MKWVCGEIRVCYMEGYVAVLLFCYCFLVQTFMSPCTCKHCPLLDQLLDLCPAVYGTRRRSFGCSIYCISCGTVKYNVSVNVDGISMSLHVFLWPACCSALLVCHVTTVWQAQKYAVISFLCTEGMKINS
ncbi:unnamed protein product [Sphacelaria rigidula]